MSFQFIRVPDGQESSQEPPGYAVRYVAIGSSSISYVEAYTIAATPSIIAATSGILYRQDIRVKQTAYNYFSVDVPYAKGKFVTGDWTWDFDTTGGTVHISNAKAEIARYPAGTAPDQKGAIDIDGDQVKGVDIVIPAMKINVSYKHPAGVITMSQAKYLQSITGMVNSATFLSWAAGEVLFLGARGSDGTDSDASVSYQFAMSNNATGLTIGAITGIAKKGHELVWIRFEDKDVGGVPTRVPKFAYVDRVYDTVDLALGLGFG